jgi:DNA-binding NarL/FixJ family response regulator
MALRVVFADDNYLVREGVSGLLAEVEGIELVATAADPHSLVKAVAEHVPDCVLTDIRMPPTHTNEGIKAAKQIRAAHPEVGVVVLSQYVEEDYVFDLLADGVAGWGTCSRNG